MPIGQGIERCQGVLDQAEEQPTIAAAAQQALAVLHALAGRTTEARSLVRAARATLVELNQPVAAAASAIDEGIVHLLSGDAAAAEKVLEAGHRELEQLGEKGFYSTVTWLLAEAVAAQGRTTEAAHSRGRRPPQQARETSRPRSVGAPSKLARSPAPARTETPSRRPSKPFGSPARPSSRSYRHTRWPRSPTLKPRQAGRRTVLPPAPRPLRCSSGKAPTRERSLRGSDRDAFHSGPTYAISVRRGSTARVRQRALSQTPRSAPLRRLRTSPG